MAARPLARARREAAMAVISDDDEAEAFYSRLFDLIATGHEGASPGGYVSHNVETNTKLICQELGYDYRIIMDYMINTPELKARYDAAKEIRAYGFDEEMLAIADKQSETMVEAVDKKTMIDTRKYLQKVHNRKVYGDKVEVTSMNVDLVQIYSEAQRRLEEAINKQKQEKVVEGERVG